MWHLGPDSHQPRASVGLRPVLDPSSWAEECSSPAPQQPSPTSVLRRKLLPGGAGSRIERPCLPPTKGLQRQHPDVTPFLLLQSPVPPAQWTPNVVSLTGSAVLLSQKTVHDHGSSRASALLTSASPAVGLSDGNRAQVLLGSSPCGAGGSEGHGDTVPGFPRRRAILGKHASIHARPCAEAYDRFSRSSISRVLSHDQILTVLLSEPNSRGDLGRPRGCSDAVEQIKDVSELQEGTA